jgi:hypothetical protein
MKKYEVKKKNNHQLASNLNNKISIYDLKYKGLDGMSKDY